MRLGSPGTSLAIAMSSNDKAATGRLFYVTDELTRAEGVLLHDPILTRTLSGSADLTRLSVSSASEASR